MRSRLLLLAAVLGAEAVAVSLALDGAQLPAGAGVMVGLLRDWGAWVFRWGIGFLAIFGTFAYLRGGAAIAAGRLGWGWAGGHVLALGLFGVVSTGLYGGTRAGGAWVAAWAVLAGAVVGTALLGALGWGTVLELRRRTGMLWLGAGAGSAAACWAGATSQMLWAPATKLTFALVRGLLQLAVPELIVQPERMRLATPRFGVIISPECSGVEGMGLLAVFGVMWLVVFRKELRFPQALAVVPVGMVVLYLLNAVRIAALLLIGDAGMREIAARGFHSQAGWITFNVVALGMAVGARRVRWLVKDVVKRETAENPAAAYLVPFLAIVGAGLLSGAMTAEFEWLYGMRVLAAGWALWWYRGEYAGVDWRGGWFGVAVGTAVFALWVGADLALGGVRTLEPIELREAGGAARGVWLLLRVIGGVVAVPVAEELAFRGFGVRRLIAEEFETVDWRRFSWVSMLGSSIVFGAMHGRMWGAGIVAGMAYAWAVRREGRLGEAVVAHGVTNLLLAVYVVISSRWHLW